MGPRGKGLRPHTRDLHALPTMAMERLYRPRDIEE